MLNPSSLSPVGVDAAPAIPARAQRVTPTRARYLMLSLVLGATVVNYLDRVNLSVVAPFMAKDLGIDKVHLGLIFSAFAWTYAICLLPGGWIVDRIGSRIAYGASMVLWSIATAIQALTTGVASLLGCRLAVGLLESPAFPANARAVTMWFPQKERGLATSVYVMGQYIGTALFSGLLLWVTHAYGWRVVFLASGAIGVVYGIFWLATYRDPRKSRRANAAEVAHIEEGGALASNKEHDKISMSQFFEIIRNRQVVALCLGKFANNTVLTFFLTWFPTYLIEQRHMTLIKVGFFAALPYLGASVGVLAAGWVSDWMLRRGFSLTAARKTPLVVGVSMGVSIILVNYTNSDWICIAILTTAFFAQGIASSSWATASEVAPKEALALTASVTSFAANLTGIVTPTVIGYIVSATGSFEWAINFIAAMALVGVFAYTVLLGKISRIELKSRSA
ncbi:MAG: MFS transporter [Burkholderiaceae bacterium]|nr:MAG: MFS transporter [Burkholderiaceae bacterium]TBR75480.1 MAG: MFS transporter [Burkholderiaceae bacterium]